MKVSFWRGSHRWMAAIASLFLFIASVTGVILAVNITVEDLAANKYKIENIEDVPVAGALKNLNRSFSEITTITVDEHHRVVLKGLDDKGNDISVFVDPRTGLTLGSLQSKSPFIQNVTALHRSLFLHGPGRIIMGVNAALLFLIALTGIVLLWDRQRGLSHFFGRVQRSSSFMYYHLVLGRLFLIPILILAFTGAYMVFSHPEGSSGSKVDKEVQSGLGVSSNQAADSNAVALSPENIGIFKTMRLVDVKLLQLPFPGDPSDTYVVKLKDRTLYVDQFSGNVIRSISNVAYSRFSPLVKALHTGSFSFIWALILAFSSIGLLILIVTGWILYWRRKGVCQQKSALQNDRFIVLYGSENGSTRKSAMLVGHALLAQGFSVYVCSMNEYRLFPAAEHLIVLTSTYGKGVAPSSAGKFTELLAKVDQDHPIQFSVVAFGSDFYPEFCAFGLKIDLLLREKPWASPLLDVHTVNNQSQIEFLKWAEEWSLRSGIKLSIQD